MGVGILAQCPTTGFGDTVNQRLAALRFNLVKTLHRPWDTPETPYPKRVIHLPIIMSPEEVGLPIESADLPFHRVMLMTLHAAGARRSELANMRVRDIDSKRMVVRVHGKGRKDRKESMDGFRAASAANALFVNRGDGGCLRQQDPLRKQACSEQTAANLICNTDATCN